MKSEQQYFEQGLTLQQYMDDMTQLQEESFAVYHSFNVSTEDSFIAFLQQQKVHILAITEFWCGDAALNNSILRRIAEAANVEVRVAFRDADTELIDRYLTNGGRAIPIYVVLNEAGQVVAKWGPRAPELQQYVVDLRSTLPDKEHPTFEEAQKQLYVKLRTDFIENKQFHQFVYEDIKRKITEQLA